MSETIGVLYSEHPHTLARLLQRPIPRSPYNEEVIKAYLSNTGERSNTRKTLGGFTHIETVYRYYRVPEEITILPSGVIVPQNPGIVKIATNGYTAVFRKDKVE